MKPWKIWQCPSEKGNDAFLQVSSKVSVASYGQHCIKARAVNPFKFWFSYFLEGRREDLVYFTLSVRLRLEPLKKKKVHELL